MRKITDYTYKNKRVLLRLDLNLPVKNGKFSDITRISRSLKTINYLINQEAKIVILSHMGRPEKAFSRDLSLAPTADLIENLIGRKVGFCSNIWSEKTLNKTLNMSSGDIIVIENLRFWPGESKNEENFAQRLKSLGDFYINDSFSCSHRNHASITSIAKILPSAAGFALIEEVENISKFLNAPQKPMSVIIGGSKISSKIGVLDKIIEKADNLIVAGAMSNSFLKFKNYEIGDSDYEKDMTDVIKKIYDKAAKFNCNIVIPSDAIISKTNLIREEDIDIVTIGYQKFSGKIFDIGPDTITSIENILKKSSTIIWNGPLGFFENSFFDISTRYIARVIADLTSKSITDSIAGGGETVSAIKSTGVSHKFSYISTGGGAFLEYLEDKILPGVAVLSS